LPLLLCLHLQGCVWTVYNWREIPDPDTIEQYPSKSEKQEHYQKHAIQDLNFKSSFFIPFRMAFSTIRHCNDYNRSNRHGFSVLILGLNDQKKLKNKLYIV